METIKRQYEIKQEFIDFSKTEEGQRIFAENAKLWIDNDYQKHVKMLKDKIQIELAQILRKYQSSFVWINKNIENHKAFQIRHMPTIRPEDLDCDFLIKEGYLWLEIFLPKNYPENEPSFLLLNPSIPNDFKRVFERILFDKFFETNTIISTLRYMDNNLDKIFKMIKDKSYKSMSELLGRGNKMEDLESKFNRFLNETSQVKENKTPSNEWSQEDQKKLEKALIECKDIKDPKEKWTKIASYIPGKAMGDCVKRFKECKQIAEKNRIVEKEKDNSSSGEEEEEKKKVDSTKMLQNKEENNNNDNNDDDSETSSNDSEEEDSEEDSDGYTENVIRDMSNDNTDILPYALEYKIIAAELLTKKISLGILLYAQVQVGCQSCNSIHQLEVNRSKNAEYLLNDNPCPKCAADNALMIKPEYLHSQSNIVAKFGVSGWDVRDFHFCEYMVTCEFCNTSNKTKRYMSAQQLNLDCTGCYKKMEFAYTALFISYFIADQIQEKGNKKYVQALDQQKKNIQIKKNIGQFKQGQPLPKNGACKHYKHSYRYFRFPCCGKAYPCDDCHNDVEREHDMERAKSMICGYCSTEQLIKDTCKKCEKELTKIISKTGYWEGGKGTRNKAAMSKKDPHKYSNSQFKTVPNKSKNKNQKK